MPEFNQRCPVCRKTKFFIKKWRYTHPTLPSGGLTSDVAVCWTCHKNTNALNLGKWSIRHYKTFAEKFLGMVKKQGTLDAPVKNELDPQVPPTILGWITKLYITVVYSIIKITKRA